MNRIIVDIARPPGGTLSLFNLYVALSQSSGRSIRLLRDFNADLLRQRHKKLLLKEDDRIKDLDIMTWRAWSR